MVSGMTKRSHRANERDASKPVDAFEAWERLVWAVTRTYFALSAAAERILAGHGITPGQHGLLTDLTRMGPTTVPRLAAARPVARQYIQTLCNALADEGLVAFRDNPRHRRSRLVTLTPAGKALLTTVRSELAEFAAPAIERVPPADLEHARDILLVLRGAAADSLGDGSARE
jgi:DNA-binding MarR family transcriptional regulator